MHRIDGPGATVDNRFTDGDPVGGVQATMVTDDWANDVQEELMSILVAGGVAPIKGTQNQVLSALTNLIRGQGFSAYTTAGTSPAFTITPSPAIAAYAVNQRFSVKFNAAAPTSGTLDVSGKGPKNLKQYDSTGTKVATVIAANQVTDVVYDGTDFVVLAPLPVASNQPGIQGSAKNLAGAATGLSAVVTYTADEIVVESASNSYQTLRSVSITPSFANAGANGLDIGAANSQAASTWYSVWMIWDGTTRAGLLSLSATAPTLPSGYTHKARVGWVFTDATASKFPLRFTQIGRSVQCGVLAGSNSTAARVMAAGTQGDVFIPTWVSVSLAAFCPTTASKIKIFISDPQGVGGGTSMVAPNNQYGGISSTTNPPPIFFSTGATAVDFSLMGDLMIEGASIYFASSNPNASLRILGWEDNL